MKNRKQDDKLGTDHFKSLTDCGCVMYYFDYYHLSKPPYVKRYYCDFRC